MPLIIRSIFDNSDECIKTACGYINKNKEKCKVIIGIELYDDFHFKILFKSSQRSFTLKTYSYLQYPPILGSLYYLILDKYKSIEDFVNNHYKLITFL